MPPPNTPEEGVLPVTMSYRRPREPVYSRRYSYRRTSTGPSVSPPPPVRLPTPPPAPSPSVPDAPRPSSATRRCSSKCQCIPKLDYQSLDYEVPVDPALQCPICHTPFHQPVTTRTCGHTFCSECLDRSLETQPVCPIDRQPVNPSRDLFRARVISDQLERLKVKCPNKGCDEVCTRELVVSHFDLHCDHTLVHCPDPFCNLRIPRADAQPSSGCLHKNTPCQYCGADVMIADLESHYDDSCSGHTAKCSHCNAIVVRHHMEKHLAKECLGREIHCKNMEYGCQVLDRRPIVEEHERLGCVFEAIGKLVLQRMEDRARIEDLEGRLRTMDARAQRAENTSTSPSSRPRMGSNSFMPGFAPDANIDAGPRTPAGNPAWRSPEDYMLVQFERLEAKIEDLQKMTWEFDGQQAVRQLNDALRMQEQIHELSNRVTALSLQVRSLAVNAQQQSNAQQRNGSSGSPSTSSSGTGGPGTRAPSHEDGRRYHSNPPPRRNSDGRGQHPPRL
ncbi:hypothetical protein B0H63DRAFT_158442 [Podospora didyma]|uniref:Uncharacterized protein n=1 Tax=Podospora didyma TaxID=330526 RepID=A0AAE0NTN9_9PEZI|nr:hypothetical protein B0H63DRAFT_158442 [Podospora didyma]